MDEAIILRYLQGECTAAEERMVLDWLESSEENRVFFYDMKAVWHARSIEYFRSGQQLDKALVRFNHIAEKHRRRQLLFRMTRYAAVVVLAVALSLLAGYLYQGSNTSPNLVTISVAQTDSSRLIVLSDGSRVWLNNNSSISYPSRFASGGRKVIFSGEAYFDITHDAARPFKVETPSMQVQVLGTAFNIRAYSSEQKAEATLVRGKVAIQDHQGRRLTVIAPGQMASIDKSSGRLSVNAVDTTLYTRWRHAQIVLNRVTLRDITLTLGQLYQVHFDIDSLKTGAATYNFSFPKNQPVENVMEMLAFIAPIRYRSEGKTIFITGK